MANCNSCGRTIGAQEQPFSYGGNVICRQCAELVSTASLPAGPSGDPLGQAGRPLPNGMATASLVCALIGFLPPAGILAIILGGIGVSRACAPRVGGKGTATAGLILGIVWLCVLPAAIPVYFRGREQMHRSACAANLSMIGRSIMLYMADNNGRPPDDLSGSALFDLYGLSDRCLVCPSSDDTAATSARDRKQPGHCSYIYLGKGKRRPSATTILVCERSNHRGDGMNLLFGDGHVEWRTWADAARLTSAQEGGSVLESP